MNRDEAIINYKFAVLNMLRHVSLCSTADFMDSVNQVLKARNDLLKFDVSAEEAMACPAKKVGDMIPGKNYI